MKNLKATLEISDVPPYLKYSAFVKRSIFQSEKDEACQVDAYSLTSLDADQSNIGLTRTHVELAAKPQLNVSILRQNDEVPLAEEFKTSLGKLDTLINTLNSLKVYKTEEPRPDISLNQDSSKESLKFNVALNNACIKCKIQRDRHTMSIVNNTDTVSQTQEFTKCDAELMVQQDDIVRDSELSKENNEDQGGQLVRTYGRKGHFGMFSKIYRHLRLIKNDVTTMKKILCSVECVVDKEDKSRFSFRFGDIRSWLPNVI
ncbi:unnamed protein product [Callosobruchus maculatus]|uniref:Uncharacterized protein n=1 Tax=Callosobruchus maculatus TaxID=64391 RepID=A0A653C4Y0_CALMS|nr:unnamed protein product [Callosobruchus maculatus]